MSAIAMIAYRTTTVRAGEADDGDTGLRNEMFWRATIVAALRGITYGDC